MKSRKTKPLPTCRVCGCDLWSAAHTYAHYTYHADHPREPLEPFPSRAGKWGFIAYWVTIALVVLGIIGEVTQ